MRFKIAILFAAIVISVSCSQRIEQINGEGNKYYGYNITLESEDSELKYLAEDIRRYISSLSREREENLSIRIILNRRDDCSECYNLRFSYDNNIFRIDVYGGFPLGIQYGVYEVLEMIGYRFLSPYREYVPDGIKISDFRQLLESSQNKIFRPFLGRRGLHLHTLHPIESLYDVWLGSETDNAFRIIDYLIKIRGNYIQWVALRDILNNDRFNEWKAKTEKIINYAHKRGVKTGLNCLVFAASSLQNGYVIEKREDLDIFRKLNFDVINLSFGEFVGNEPSKFISEIRFIADEIHSINPSIEITGTIHVENFDNLWINYNGETLLYYFLVKYVEEITPYVHTVMYFNLTEPAVGAYNHKTFKEHREFLADYLKREKKVIYNPESAYWIAFDNSIPLYLPLYLRSRYLDIELMNKECKSEMCRKNTGHIIFTSGWEWGYHQTDYLSTRISYDFGRGLKEELIRMFEPMGEDGRLAGQIVYELSEIQAEFLIYKRLAPYYAGVDAWVELGHKSGIIGQPDRIMVDEIQGLSEERREIFRQNILNNLYLFSQKMGEFYKKAENIRNIDGVEFIDEIIDGVNVDYYRSVFVYNVYASVFYNKSEYLKTAEDAMNKAGVIIEKRHKNLYYPQKDLILYTNQNPTIYKFGYLKQADQMCLYKRDLIKARNLLTNGKDTVPSCVE
ncbi:MAG: hypothetical protein N3B13_00795 [Deltaproteobacteria bacterium]|nr:hypothetical protein [Deltaproteobacteria bacterium]